MQISGYFYILKCKNYIKKYISICKNLSKKLHLSSHFKHQIPFTFNSFAIEIDVAAGAAFDGDGWASYYVDVFWAVGTSKHYAGGSVGYAPNGRTADNGNV